jgi:hypothetical protein
VRRTPGFGETNLGAVAGAVVGSIGGLFAIGIGPAIVSRNVSLLFGTPILGLVSWIVCLVAGWFIGGQIGPRVGFVCKSPRAETVGGALAGFIPVLLIILFGWYMALSR